MSDIHFLKTLGFKLGLLKDSSVNVVDGNQDRIEARLHRIQGQLRGILKMYQQERYCTDIVYQIMAVRSALNNVAKALLTDEVLACSREGKTNEVKKLMKEIIK